jgi:hypothetical protein
MDRAGQLPAAELESGGGGEEQTSDDLQVFRDFIDELDLDLGQSDD